MTDNEIIKVLELSIDAVDEGDIQTFDFLNAVVDLINRQKAEIGNLKAEIAEHKAMLKAFDIELMSLDEEIKTAKSEAIKEFAERLKESKIKPEYPWDDYYINEGTIDNLVKEMTEQAE